MIKITCEFCNHDLDIKKYYFLCNNCGKLVQLPKNLDYFSYLNIDLCYPIDSNLLESQYVKLFALYHPDNFINSDDKEKLNSINHSSFLNQAYSSLKNNTELVQYLYTLSTGDSLVSEIEIRKSTATFFFQLNEELELLSNEEQINSFKLKLQSIYNKLVHDISMAFKNKDYTKIKSELFNQLKYLDSINYRLQ